MTKVRSMQGSDRAAGVDAVLPWQTLVPFDFPTRCLNLAFRNIDLHATLACFEFTGFVPLQGEKLTRFDPDACGILAYVSPLVAEKLMAGQNHYGPVFSVTVGPNQVKLEEYADEAGQCQHTSMLLLKRLVIDPGLACRWQSFSWYYDSYEYSPICSGSEQEIRALFTARC